ncbi:MAG: L-2-hydroxyglutarate oxidase [bacterium]
MTKYDYLIVGAGIIGLTIAYELKKKYPDSKIVILEKEAEVAMHASGRNSGILHAGFYYTDNSLKARFCVQGNAAMKAFCQSQNISIANDGKLVVATNTADVATLKTLYDRGLKNGVDVRLVDEAEAKEIEPRMKTVQKALYSPNTAAVNPVKVCLHLKELLAKQGVEIKTGNKVREIKDDQVISQKETYCFKRLINCAGMFADKIAHMCDVGHQYTMIPFKGIYLTYKGEQRLNTNIYPVPNLLNPFLGVHFTKTAEGKIKIGPTAIPAFWREHYSGLSHFNLKEAIEIMRLETSMFIHNYSQFRTIAKQEFPKYWKPYLINEALKLAHFDSKSFELSPPGIRAQLFNKQTKKLEMDFIVECKKNTTHILNAVSPAFTCAFALAEYVINLIDRTSYIN